MGVGVRSAGSGIRDAVTEYRYSDPGNRTLNVMDDSFLDSDCFAEVDAASKRIAAAEKVNIWGRKRQQRDDWRPAAPRTETTMARRSKLTPEMQAEAKRDWQVIGPTNLARKFGVSQACIYSFGKQHGLTCNGRRPGMSKGAVRPSVEKTPTAVEHQAPVARKWLSKMADSQDKCESVAAGGAMAVDLGQGVSQTIQITLRISVEVVDVHPGAGYRGPGTGAE